MILSINLLNYYTNLGIDVHDEAKIKEYCEKMTNTGTKVEGYEILGGEIANVVIGKIVSIEPHPDADKLVICKVNAGSHGEKTVVTGAKNLTVGDIISVAMDNSTLPGGKKIQKSKLRGVESEGMLCSYQELNVAKNYFPYADDDGILILNSELSDADLGKDAAECLMLRDAAVEFELTSNRPDCLAVMSLARESMASYGRKYTPQVPSLTKEDLSDDVKNYVSVEVRNGTLCPRYTARAVKNVKVAPSPLWLRAYLTACDIRPINNIVDITNFVMLEYGQPMHAFDYNYLTSNKIIVRNANPNEKIITLDSQPHDLSPEMLVIADGEQAVAVAGVMGGENSEIRDDTNPCGGTTTVIFESANFNRKSIRTTAKALGMRTDSSSRFEKGLPPELTINALNRACELIELLDCGTVVGGIIDINNSKTQTVAIPLECEKINALLGSDISESEMTRILNLLDFKVTDRIVCVPYYRSDVRLTADLAEEIARIYGYNNIGAGETSDRKASSVLGSRTRQQKFTRRIHEVAAGMGLYEICTLSFTNPKIYARYSDEIADAIRLINPIGEEVSVMRTALLPNMLEVIARNRALRNDAVRFYEIGRVYHKKSDSDSKTPATEKNTMSIGITDGDFYVLKGYIESIFNAAHLDINKIVYKSGGADNILSSAFHPGKCAQIYNESGIYLGIIGEIHPILAEKSELSPNVYCAELDLDAIYSLYTDTVTITPPAKYPSVTRDLALICALSTEAAKIRSCILSSGGSLVKKAELFDVYAGDKIAPGKKSLAYSLLFSHPDRTLTDDEINGAVSEILKALESIDVSLRS